MCSLYLDPWYSSARLASRDGEGLWGGVDVQRVEVEGI